jgi:hypothetical protein
MSTMNIFDLTDTWNAGGTTFTAIKMNATDTASAAGSLLIDLQVGGVSQFKVFKGGRITAQTLTIGLGGQTSVATNTVFGLEAANSANLTGGDNVALGYRALRDNTTAVENTAVGMSSGRNHTTGGGGVFVGAYAGFACTTGANNVCIGAYSGSAFTTQAFNVFVGRDAGSRNASANNVAIGYRALRGGDATAANNSGSNNIAIGYQAGDAITTGATNIVIGHDIDVDSATGFNQINIGDRYFHDRIRLLERTSDPAKPAEGNMIAWLSDGTGLGDDGDVIISSTAGGVTNYAILFDHSAGTLWP